MIMNEDRSSGARAAELLPTPATSDPSRVTTRRIGERIKNPNPPTSPQFNPKRIKARS